MLPGNSLCESFLRIMFWVLVIELVNCPCCWWVAYIFGGFIPNRLDDVAQTTALDLYLNPCWVHDLNGRLPWQKHLNLTLPALQLFRVQRHFSLRNKDIFTILLILDKKFVGWVFQSRRFHLQDITEETCLGGNPTPIRGIRASIPRNSYSCTPPVNQ